MAVESIDGVLIKKLEPVVPGDVRGHTYEWCKGLPGMQVSVFYRKTGSIYGEHFHTGHDSSKNPERFLVLRGKVMLRATDGNDEMTTTLREAHEVLIQPYIYHTFEALSDVIFIEYRATIFDRSKPDAFDRESFKEYLARAQRPR